MRWVVFRCLQMSSCLKRTLFLTVFGIKNSAADMNNDLKMISVNGQTNRKWVLSPIHLNKLKNLFSAENEKKYYPLLVSNNSNILQTTSQKHLDIKLGGWLDFREHLKWGENKTHKTIGFLCKLQNISPKAALIAIYIAFLSPI